MSELGEISQELRSIGARAAEIQNRVYAIVHNDLDAIERELASAQDRAGLAHLAEAKRGLAQYTRETDQLARAARKWLDLHGGAPGKGTKGGVVEATGGWSRPRGAGAGEAVRSRWNPDLRDLAADMPYQVDGGRCTFRTDGQARVVFASADLTRTAPGAAGPILTPEENARRRHGGDQSSAGKGKGRLETDDGGHIFAALFGGPGERGNVVAMDAVLNRSKADGTWGALESRLRRVVEEGRGGDRVEVTIRYGRDGRPRKIVVQWNEDGEMQPPRTFTQ